VRYAQGMLHNKEDIYDKTTQVHFARCARQCTYTEDGNYCIARQSTTTMNNKRKTSYTTKVIVLMQNTT
jgi:hypothetical protein